MHHLPLLAALLIDDIIILLVIQIVLAAAVYLLSPKAKQENNPFADESRPPNYAERGTYSPWLRGRGKFGPSILWVGTRKRVKYRVNKTDAYKYVESAWHALAVGSPGWCIREIRANGKLISRGAVNRNSHPSGSVVNLGANVGTYVVFWGLPTDPVNTFLGGTDSLGKTRVGVSSSWPHLFYVVWRDFELGGSPIWPTLEYVIECRLENSSAYLTATPGWIAGTKTITGTARNIATTGVTGGVRWFEMLGDRRKEFPPVGDYCRLAGNSVAPDQDLTIVGKAYRQVTSPPMIFPVVITKYTKIFVLEPVTGATATGTLRPYTEIINNGPNAAHVIAELLFEPWPRGMGYEQGEHQISDLEAIGTAVAAEGITTHAKGDQGKTADEVLKGIFDDVGIVSAWDPRLAKWRYKLIRESSTVPLIGVDLTVAPLPTIKAMHGEPTQTKTVFTYVDRAHRFRTATAPVTDDAAESVEPRSRQARVAMETVIDEQTAAIVSERRSLETQVATEGAAFTIYADRDARFLFPGLFIDVTGIEVRLMVLETQPDEDTGKMRLDCVPDYYGAPASTYLGAAAGGLPDTDPDDPDADIAPTVDEPPNGWQSPPPGGSVGAGGPGIPHSFAHPQLYLLRLRPSTDVGATRVFLSEDDVDFVEVATVEGYQTGGYISNDLPAGEGIVEEIEVTGDGVDAAALAQDLSGDEDAWRRGDQLAFIGGEIMFVERLEVVSASELILHRCIRGRWGTEAKAHDVGTPIHVGPPDSIEPFTDEMLEVGKTVYLKTIPASGGVSYGLDEVTSFSRTITGRGIVPRSPTNLTTEDRTGTWAAGSDVPVRWNYFEAASCRTGAGFAPAGAAAAEAEVRGHFSLVIQNAAGSSTKRTIPRLSVASYTYDNADMVSDFGGSEPSEFRVVVYHHSCGFTSVASTKNIVRI